MKFNVNKLPADVEMKNSSITLTGESQQSQTNKNKDK
jgi:hypothetical protein